MTAGRNKVIGQKWTAERAEEGRRLHDLLDLAIDTDDDEMQKRHRLALQLWLGAAMQDGMFDLIDEGLRAVAEPEAKACEKCKGEGVYICARWGLPRDCEACGGGGRSAKAEPVTCHHGIVGGSSGLCSNCEAEPEAKDDGPRPWDGADWREPEAKACEAHRDPACLLCSVRR